MTSRKNAVNITSSMTETPPAASSPLHQSRSAPESATSSSTPSQSNEETISSPLPASPSQDDSDSEETSSSEESTNDEESISDSSEQEVEDTNLRSRLAAFIPRLAAANQDLVDDGAVEDGMDDTGARKRKRSGFEIVSLDGPGVDGGSNKRARRYEDSGEEDEEGDDTGTPCIEMDLSLGILEEQKNGGLRGDGMEGQVLYRDPDEEDEDVESDSSGVSENEDDDHIGSGCVMDTLTAIGQDTVKKRKEKKAAIAAGRITEIPIV